MSLRWLFGDQLGDLFTEDHDGRFLIIESRAVFTRRRFHRAKAHLVLSAMRHRAAELGDRVDYLQAETYGDALARVREQRLQVIHPTSRAALDLVRSSPGGTEVEVLPARGYVTSADDFAAWARGRGNRRLLMEDFYRDARRRTGVLMDGDDPVGGSWNFDKDNREPPPRTGLDVPGPWWPEEDEIDEQVRRDLDSWEASGEVAFVGADGPRRFAATQEQADRALDHFLEHRLEVFGTYEDAILRDDPWMAHSLVSAPLNLGLLDPLDVVRRAAERHATDGTRLASVEGFVRQVMGWRDYVWHLYWHFGEDYRTRNALGATEPLPEWFASLDADATDAACLSSTLRGLHEHGWVHHIPRLMILGSYAMQRGWDPVEVTDWFHRSFVDGYDWVMVPNVVGMSQHADGGLMATKPYTSGGAYIDRMSDYCGGCRFDPRVRVGDDACPYTAGYWAFLARHRDRFESNHRMRQPIRGLDRLKDLDEVVRQEQRRGSDAP